MAGIGALALLPGLFFLLFVALPLGALVYRTAEAGDLRQRIWQPVVRDALWLSLASSTVTLMIALAAGTPLAYLLARARFPGRRLLDTLIDLPIVLPPVVAGVALLMAFGRRGVLGGALDAAGWDVAFTGRAVIMAQVFVATPFYIRTARAGFQSVDITLEQMAYTLGASRLRTFFRITLPLAAPAVTAGAALCWARAISEFGATIMFAGNTRGATQTLPLAILSVMETDLYAALAISVLLLGVAFAVLLVLGMTSRAAA